jgi:hypothetical protein
MNVNDVIHEEFNRFINELIPTGRNTFPYEKANESGSQYNIFVDVPERGINAVMIVYFNTIGETDDKAYGISFKEKGGSWSDSTGFGVQFRLLATISKIVKELIQQYDPNVLTFSPVTKEATGQKNTSKFQRFKLYMEYVKAGAGDDYDAFIIGDNHTVNIEKKNPSFPLEGGYIEPEDVQDIVTQLSVYNGSYETVEIPENDPDYRKFVMSTYNGGIMRTPRGSKSTISVRKFVDWILNTELVEYVHGDKEPQQVTTPQRQPQPQPQGRTDAPIQRVVRNNVSAETSEDFVQFLETNVYGNSAYDVLDPYFETMKSPRDFEELKNRARQSLPNARTTADRERLLAIIDAVDRLNNSFQLYNRNTGDETLNEIINEMNNLLA